MGAHLYLFNLRINTKRLHKFAKKKGFVEVSGQNFNINFVLFLEQRKKLQLQIPLISNYLYVLDNTYILP